MSENFRETHVSTEQTRSQTPSWLSQPHGDRWRAQDHCRAPRERPQTPFRLSAHMSPTVLRLRRRPQFLNVAGTRRKWVAPGLILQIRRRPVDEKGITPEDAIRVGFTVSRKVGNAVRRNRAKRRLRAVTDMVFEKHAAPRCDFVVIGRAETLKRSFDGLVNDLQTGLKRLNAWREA